MARIWRCASRDYDFFCPCEVEHRRRDEPPHVQFLVSNHGVVPKFLLGGTGESRASTMVLGIFSSSQTSVIVVPCRWLHSLELQRVTRYSPLIISWSFRVVKSRT